MSKRWMLTLAAMMALGMVSSSCTFLENLTGNGDKEKKDTIDTEKVEKFLAQRAPQTEKEMDIYRDNVVAATKGCNLSGGKRDAACVAKVHTRARQAWLEGIDALIDAEDGENAHWASRWLLGWYFKAWYGEPWWQASRDVPRELLVKAGALEAKELNARWAKRKNYAPLNGAECVPTTKAPGPRDKALVPTFTFKPGDDVHVRCYYDKPLGEFSDGMKDAKLVVRLTISTDKQKGGEKYEIPVSATKLAKQDYFDYAVSLGDWAKGATFGYASTEAVFVHVTGYKEEWDDYRKVMLKLPVTAELFTPMSFSFSK